MRAFIRGFAIILILGMLAGVIYERVGKQRDQERLPRMGQAVDIGGRSLNIYCSGSGSPSVILDSGGSAPGYSNKPIQKLISNEAPTCWFDRSGLLWSGAHPIAQTTGTIEGDLPSVVRVRDHVPP